VRRVLPLLLVLALAGCTPVSSLTTGPEAEGVQPEGNPTTLASDLVTPWSIALFGDGALISERDTALVKYYDGTSTEVVGEVPGVDPQGEGGLLGLAIDPDDDGWLYAYLTAAADNRVVRLPLTVGAAGPELGSPEVVIDGLPKGTYHNGGRIKFGPDGDLYITAGDAGFPDGAQDVTYLGGKILRIAPDGTYPADNPYANSPVYSLGHRNPQGIAWDDDGQLYAAEFGQDTWDEFNRIDAGANYGWPIVEGIGDQEGFVDPLAQWPTDDASPSGLAFIRGTFFLAALRGERVWVIYVDGDRADPVSWFEGELGRVRDVAESPDGNLWLLTSNTDGNGDQRDGADLLTEYRLGELVEG
jgi:glucose/arabinose dehydrogenase